MCVERRRFRIINGAYGAAIRNHLTDVTDEDWSIGSVYGTLDRLARQGFVRTFMGAPTPERGGRSKRFFQLTAEGVAALNCVRSVQESMWQGLPTLAFGDAG